jgi:polysaccharide pyruvyl transferase WcaK-like protein
MIVVTHAFSRRNAGDSLLIDLTLSHLERAGFQPSECCVLALDADSFRDLPCVRQVPSEPWRKLSLRALGGAGQLAIAGLTLISRGRLRLGEIADSIASARGIVATGGGYLRGGTPVAAMGSLLNHVPQLALAAQADGPAVYLPQTIGPLTGPVGRVVGRLLSRVDLVCLRDDESFQEVRRYAPVKRLPDLAVMQLAESLEHLRPNSGGEGVVLVARDLGGDAGYEGRLQALVELLGPVTWAVQSDAVGKKSDRRFYETLRVRAEGSVAEALEGAQGGTVVSVRLHGALQAMLAGWPAIHLSYERKGWGAYQDLGVERYVHDARNFDPALVAQQVKELCADPHTYWAAIQARRPDVLRASADLTSELRRLLDGAPDPPSLV